MIRRFRRWSLVVAGALVVTAVTACTSPNNHKNAPAPPVAVSLRVDAPDQLVIGVVASLAAAPGEGAEWRDPAEGAQVARRRFAMGGADVTVLVVNDKGTVAGAAAAVRTLVGRRVAGIVLATSGDHVTGALKEGEGIGVAMLLPYVDDVENLRDHVWLTGPDGQAVDARLIEALKSRGATKPFLIDAGGGPIKGLSTKGSLSFDGGDPEAFAKALSRRMARPDRRFDAVVVSGPAQLQASAIRALQGAEIDVPFFLTPQALSPTFPAALAKAEGSQSGDFISVGLNNGDPAALDSSAAGSALTAFFAALRLTAGDLAATDAFGDRPFSAVANVADARSHDAVVALVRAAEAAHSTDPTKVADALSRLRLSNSDGLAGPALDFSSSTAVADEAVVALTATTQSPGLRPTPDKATPALFWFPLKPS